MTRTMQANRETWDLERRTSWTRFHLPRGQDWPTWLTGGSLDLGPLTGVTGCGKVWLGRQVDDCEQAAIIIREFSSAWGFMGLLLICDKKSLGHGR